jgi:hypothetical protein
MVRPECYHICSVTAVDVPVTCPFVAKDLVCPSTCKQVAVRALFSLGHGIP